MNHANIRGRITHTGEEQCKNPAAIVGLVYLTERMYLGWGKKDRKKLMSYTRFLVGRASIPGGEEKLASLPWWGEICHVTLNERKVFAIITKSPFHSDTDLFLLFVFFPLLYIPLLYINILPILNLCIISILSISAFLIMLLSTFPALQESVSKTGLHCQDKKKGGEHCNGFSSTDEHTAGSDLPHLPGSSDNAPESGLWPQLLPSLHHCKESGFRGPPRRGKQLPSVPVQIPVLESPT